MTEFKRIVIIAVSLRIIAGLFLPGIEMDYYWEYGEIAKNLINGKGYSLLYVEGDKIAHHFKSEASPYPSAYMPPGYVLFLFPFMYLPDILLRNILIYSVQIIASVLVLFMVYRISERFFGIRAALISGLIYAVTPEFIVGSLSFTPTVFYQLLSLMVLYLLLFPGEVKLLELKTAGLLSLLIFFRSETILFLGGILSVFLVRKKFKPFFIILCTVVLFLLPWSVRNYQKFNEIIPLTTSYGLNLYRGNNSAEMGYWGNPLLLKEIRSYKGDDFEVKMSRVYVREVEEFFSQNTSGAILNLGAKFFYFWVYYPNYGRANNIFYLVPGMLILYLFLYGIISAADRKKYIWFYLFFAVSTAVAVIFVPLPRYQTMMKTAMLPFCGFAAHSILVLVTLKFNRRS